MNIDTNTEEFKMFMQIIMPVMIKVQKCQQCFLYNFNSCKISYDLIQEKTKQLKGLKKLDQNILVEIKKDKDAVKYLNCILKKCKKELKDSVKSLIDTIENIDKSGIKIKEKELSILKKAFLPLVKKLKNFLKKDKYNFDSVSKLLLELKNMSTKSGFK